MLTIRLARSERCSLPSILAAVVPDRDERRQPRVDAADRIVAEQLREERVDRGHQPEVRGLVLRDPTAERPGSPGSAAGWVEDDYHVTMMLTLGVTNAKAKGDIHVVYCGLFPPLAALCVIESSCRPRGSSCRKRRPIWESAEGRAQPQQTRRLRDLEMLILEAAATPSTRRATSRPPRTRSPRSGRPGARSTRCCRFRSRSLHPAIRNETK
ncbi:MAG: hypothetical protein MZV63_14180, partial [Marinilabiliales bacterium]|nr:hypothetical protein [Marinilabiliales bacterium]